MPERTIVPVWPRVKERLGVALWTSFLAAGGETAVLFALVDPGLLRCENSLLDWLCSRSTAYGVGFFLLWLGAFAPAALTAYMLDSRRGSRAHGAELLE